MGYAALLTFEDENLVIGSGFYPAMPTPFAPPIGYVVLTLLLTGAGWLRLRCMSSSQEQEHKERSRQTDGAGP